MLETAIYVRVSTDEQAQEGYSIRAQEEKLRDYAKVKEWLVYKVYIDDGIGGGNITARPAINEMIEDVKNGRVKNVLIFKIDRLTRNLIDLINLVALFNEQDCAFNSLSESIDTHSATGRMFIKILGIFAEFERENISERVRLGFERKVREGYSLCSTHNPSYGYSRKIGEKIQTINEKEAVIVQEIFRIFLESPISYHHIARNLNDRNIPTRTHSKWWGRTISDILTNCNYKGYVRYCTEDKERYFETKGHHEPIISEEVFDDVQAIIKKRAVKVYKKHPRENNYFAGIIFCGICNAKMMVYGKYIKDEDGNDISDVSYACPNRRKKECDAISSKQAKIESAFIEYINNFEDFDTLDEIQLVMKKEIKDKNIELVKDYNRKYAKIECKEKELIHTYMYGDIDIENYKLLKTSIDKEKKQLSCMIEALEVLIDDETTIRKENIIKSLKQNWNFLDNTEKRQFLINFVERIEVINDKENGKRGGTVKIVNVEFNKD